MAAYPGITTFAEGVIHSRIARVAISREALGYEDDFFSYPYGAVYCGVGADGNCLGEPPKPDIINACVGFPDEASSAPRQAPLSIAELGGRLLITAPGEFSTALGRRMREAASAATGFDDVVLVGYAQDYLGYALPEEDWWQGGYEAAGGLWGPKQGDHLAAASISLAESYGDPSLPLGFADLGPVPTPPEYDYIPQAPMVTMGEPGVIADAVPAPTLDTTVQVGFALGDPWLGAPLVTLERQATPGGDFEPALLGNGATIHSDDYSIALELVVDPPYTQSAPARVFQWVASLPITRPHGGGPALAGGTFRLVAEGRVAHEDGTITDHRLESGSFGVPAQ